MDDWFDVVHKAFVPTAPISDRDRLADRVFEFHAAQTKLAQPHQHLLVYGPRGAGKTSLIRTLSSRPFRPGGVLPTYCEVRTSEDDTFSRLAENIRKTVQEEVAALGITPEADTRSDGRLGSSVRDLVAWLTRISRQRPLLIALDEFERRLPDETRTRLAETLKHLSENRADAQFVIVGVADNADDLMIGHESITHRQLSFLDVRPMTLPATIEVLRLGFEYLGANGWVIDQKAPHVRTMVENIAYLSQGLPTIAHRLATYVLEGARRREGIALHEIDLKRALDRYASDIRQIPGHPADQVQFPDRLLLACAAARTDDHGWFTPYRVADSLSTLWADHTVGERDLFRRLSRYVAAGVFERPPDVGADDAVDKYRFRSSAYRPDLLIWAASKEWITLAKFRQLWHHEVDQLLDEAEVLAETCMRSTYDPGGDLENAGRRYVQFTATLEEAVSAADRDPTSDDVQKNRIVRMLLWQEQLRDLLQLGPSPNVG